MQPVTYEARTTRLGATVTSVAAVDADVSMFVTVTLSIPVIFVVVALWP